MKPPVINPSFGSTLAAVSERLPHALLLVGVPGIGLMAIASLLADKSLTNLLQPHTSKGERDDQHGTIGIDAIRTLYDSTQGKKQGRQVVVIDNADRMSLGAQGAFLKLLEEPTEGTHFILTSHFPDTLTVTIRSRTQRITIPPITQEQSRDLIASLGVNDTKKAAQILFLAQGRPAEINRLASDSAYFERESGIIRDARQLVAAGAVYEKLAVISRYRSDRDAAVRLIDSTISLIKFTLPNRRPDDAVAFLDNLILARERIAANGAIRLHLARIVL